MALLDAGGTLAYDDFMAVLDLIEPGGPVLGLDEAAEVQSLIDPYMPCLAALDAAIRDLPTPGADRRSGD